VQLQRSAGHFEPWYYYLPRFPMQALPATLLLPWLIRDAIRTHFWRGDPRVRFIATSIFASFTAWSLLPQKQLHYLLPIAPLYALLCGVFLARLQSVRRALGSASWVHGRAPADASAGSSARYSQ
jgi:hypothetical protein